MIATTYAWIALFAPLAGCVLIALLGTWLPQRAAGYLASLAVQKNETNIASEAR